MSDPETQSQKSLRVLALDLSLHTGWALLEDSEALVKPNLIAFGAIHLGQAVVGYKGLWYPWSYMLAVRDQIEQVQVLIRDHDPDVIVIENTNGGKNRNSQRVLEWLHYELLSVLERRLDQIPVYYLDSSTWRSVLGLRMSKEQKRANAKLARAKRKAQDTGTKLNKKALGIRGRIGVKHLALAWVNENYGLQLKVKDNDAADAICLGVAYARDATPSDGT